MRDGKNVILVIEDDPKLMESICIFMEQNDYTVLCAESGEESLKLFFSANHEIDLILLDIMLPGIDGFQVLKAVREYSKVPLIIITSQDSDEAQLKGLTGGADNYITKPFRLHVLMAHIRNLLSRCLDTSGVIRFGRLSIEAEYQRVKIDDEFIPLTPKEFSMLMFFVKNREKVLSRTAILDSVWGFDYDGDIRTVDTLVKQLRRKLGDRCPYLHTVYGAGYCFKES